MMHHESLVVVLDVVVVFDETWVCCEVVEEVVYL